MPVQFLMRRKHWTVPVCGLLAAVSLGATAAPGDLGDPIDTPAVATSRAALNPLIAVGKAGRRLVAVGLRGLVLCSDDEGTSWTQSAVPVSSDLVALHFPTPEQGWAVGHDGVILHTADSGRSWTKQLDGRKAGELTIAYYQKRADDGDAVAAKALKTAKLNYEAGPDLPFLGVWFENEREGYVVGSFGLILATRDGGKNWLPWLDRIDNDQGLNLNAVRGVAGAIYIAAERGVVFRLDRNAQRFVAQRTGYAGSFFGIVGRPGLLLVFGLRGSAYRSLDAGKSWTPVETGIIAGLTGGTILDDGRIVLVSQGGQVLLGRDGAQSFQRLPVQRPELFTDVVAVNAEHIIVSSRSGMQTQTLNVKE